MEFIELNNADIELLEKIEKLEMEAFEGQGGVDFWILKALIRYGKVFILREEEELVSIAEYMQIFEKKEVFLYGLCTAKKYRNRGNAKKILELSEMIFRKKGYERIYLTVAPNNELAINLYEKQGYKIEKLEKDEYGKNIDRYLMKKVLIS